MSSSMFSTITEWFRLSRWPEWYTSKLPYLGAAALLLAPPDASVLTILAMLGTIAFMAVFGYAINDVADRDADLRVGKPNRAAGLPGHGIAAFLSGTGMAAVGFTIMWAPDSIAPVIVTGGMALAAAYSLRPVRLKERGAVGLLAGAGAQWVIPVLALSAVRPRGWVSPEAWCLAFLGFAVGIRWMAVHQLLDTSADRASGVSTYVAKGGPVQKWLASGLVLEVALLSATLLVTWPQSLAAVVALCFWAVQEWVVHPQREPFAKRLQGYDHAPLAEYYFLLFPLSLALQRVGASPTFSVAALGFLVLGWCYVEAMVGEWRDAFQR